MNLGCVPPAFRGIASEWKHIFTVATALHFKSLCEGRRSFYTSPIKALVNEKFLALCQGFGPEQVGMITGDGTVNPQAPIICCTAEILSIDALRHGEGAPIDDVVM